jgi:hydroxymethylbilane synthase
MRKITVGTRGSRLAIAQAQLVLDALALADRDLEVETKIIRTEGDARDDVSLNDIGGQGVFVKDIERALAAGGIDVAVHSLKDMPADLPPGLTIGAVLERGDARDALVGRNGLRLAALPRGARVGTDSRRRAVQLQALRPDIKVESIRGNVDSRIKKVESGEYEAACLAVAGLRRIGLLDHASQVFEVDEMLPAPGQAVLAVEAREDDQEVIDLLHRVDHPPTRAEITAERAFLRRLGAGCRLPVAA